MAKKLPKKSRKRVKKGTSKTKKQTTKSKAKRISKTVAKPKVKKVTTEKRIAKNINVNVLETKGLRRGLKSMKKSCRCIEIEPGHWECMHFVNGQFELCAGSAGYATRAECEAQCNH